ncbi:unnamed protein product [Meloidogyne enterolobii]|uniref:Uncharacterized protein n=1 Tax=Meloidogyne enterolobii TaxID=390850 RepID=A0ACB1APZ6_MELEN
MNNEELKVKMLIEKYKSDNKKFLFLSSLTRKNIINEDNALDIIREAFADKTDYSGVFNDLVNNDRHARRHAPYHLPRRRGSTINLSDENEEPNNDIGCVFYIILEKNKLMKRVTGKICIPIYKLALVLNSFLDS